MNYLILNKQRSDIGISILPYPIDIYECKYIWENAVLDNCDNDYIIKNKKGIIVAFYPKQTTVIFSDIKELIDNNTYN